VGRDDYRNYANDGESTSSKTPLGGPVALFRSQRITETVAEQFPEIGSFRSTDQEIA
jgi:hypothetical protein